MRTRHVVVWTALSALFGVPGTATSQVPDEWRSHFAAGAQARQSGDVDGYADAMAAAASAMPTGLLNRPFVQYHAARSASLAGRSGQALRWLRSAWEEDIEALMIGFARFDPAFDSMRGSEDFRAVMSLPDAMTLSVRPLRGDVVLLQGAGANVLVHVGEGEVTLVDTGYDLASPAIERALADLGAGSLGTVIVTHPHEDHMGGTPAFGPDTRVVGHPATTAAMQEPLVFMEDVSVPPKPAGALPDLEVSSDTTLILDGEAVWVVPTEAHTGGDLSVYFTRARVAHLGDTYLGGNPMMYPGTDDPDGFLSRLEAFLDRMDPETLVVGGHDGPTTLEAVREQIEATRACMALVRTALGNGLSLEEAVERAEGRYPPQWIGFFYELFSEGGLFPL